MAAGVGGRWMMTLLAEGGEEDSIMVMMYLWYLQRC